MATIPTGDVALTCTESHGGLGLRSDAQIVLRLPSMHADAGYAASKVELRVAEESIAVSNP